MPDFRVEAIAGWPGNIFLGPPNRVLRPGSRRRGSADWCKSAHSARKSSIRSRLTEGIQPFVASGMASKEPNG